MSTYYIAYWPDCDAIDNCGFLQDVEDFRPGAFQRGASIDLAEEDRRFRKVTQDLAAEPGPALNNATYLAVHAESPPGFTYAELRRAATAYRQAHGLGCYIREEGRDPDLGLCGAPALDNGRCAEHAETAPYYSSPRQEEAEEEL
jgi:hypothetical protein